MPPRETYYGFDTTTAATTAAETYTIAVPDLGTTVTPERTNVNDLNTTITYADLNTIGGPVTGYYEPITFTWRDEKEERIRALEKSTEEIKEKFDAILKKLDQVLGDKLVISDLDLARLLGLGEV